MGFGTIHRDECGRDLTKNMTFSTKVFLYNQERVKPSTDNSLCSYAL